MKVHEYQARQLLAEAGVPVPEAIVVETSQQAQRAYDRLTTREGATCCIIKAQVHAGGRGKGGGVRPVCAQREAYDAAHAILSRPLVTPQTGPEGIPVRKLMVAASVDVAREYYLSIALDRARNQPVLIASAEGGMEIEEIARTKPEAVIKEHLHPNQPLQPYQARKVAYRMGFKGKQGRAVARIMHAMADLFLHRDCMLIEINPLVVTRATDSLPDGQVLALDAKMIFDDNAVFRHKDVQEMYDPTQEPAADVEARRFNLSYIKLDGNIGCMVNGAGLAMSTMDLIKLHGGEPANFLDVGGGASVEAMTEAFKIILADRSVKGVLVNIFGGINRCDFVANAIVETAKKIGFDIPLVVRLEGTKVEDGRSILEEARSQLPTLIPADDLADAAKKVSEAVGVAATAP